jgi:hypothetical protein
MATVSDYESQALKGLLDLGIRLGCTSYLTEEKVLRAKGYILSCFSDG